MAPRTRQACHFVGCVASASLEQAPSLYSHRRSHRQLETLAFRVVEVGGLCAVSAALLLETGKS